VLVRPAPCFLGATALIVGLAFAPGRAAAFPNLNQHKNAHEHSAVVAELHGIKLMLEHADHDYKGHRAAAVKDLGEAIHELHPQHKAHTGGTQKTGTHAKGSHEPQKLSDAQLRQAISKLEGIEGHLGKHKAAHHVAHAIAELKTALTVK
jgi:hypothetical protein